MAGERGATRIADLVVEKIAAQAAREALAPLPPDAAWPNAAVVVLPQALGPARAEKTPTGTARVRVSVNLGYPRDIASQCRAVRHRIAERVGALTGMEVRDVAVQVERLHPSPASGAGTTSEFQGREGTRRLPVIEKTAGGGLGQSSCAAVHEPADGAHGAGHRFWSARRVPAGVVALLVVIGAGLLLYDIAAVRAHRPAMRWRRDLARELAGRPLDDTWMLVGASVVVLLGLWLLVLAVTPGVREVLPMRPAHADVRAGLHRDAAAMVLRDRAMEVSGVRSVAVRLGRRRADVRAVSHFRELDEVRGDLDTTLAEAVAGLGLIRPPAVSVHVRRPGRKG